MPVDRVANCANVMINVSVKATMIESEFTEDCWLLNQLSGASSLYAAQLHCWLGVRNRA
jgi:hypothetical protein